MFIVVSIQVCVHAHMCSYVSAIWFTYKQCFILFWERKRKREREHASGVGEAEGEGGRESQADSILSGEPDEGLDLMTLRSWPEPKSRAVHLTDCATQVPHKQYFSIYKFIAVPDQTGHLSSPFMFSSTLPSSTWKCSVSLLLFLAYRAIIKAFCQHFPLKLHWFWSFMESKPIY